MIAGRQISSCLKKANRPPGLEGKSSGLDFPFPGFISVAFSFRRIEQISSPSSHFASPIFNAACRGYQVSVVKILEIQRNRQPVRCWHNACYRPCPFRARAAGFGAPCSFRPRYILGYIIQWHTIREFPFFDPEKGILIISCMRIINNPRLIANVLDCLKIQNLTRIVPVLFSGI